MRSVAAGVAWRCALAAGTAAPRTARSRSTAARSRSATVYVTLSALSWDPQRLELEAEPRHRPVPRAAVRRRPRQERGAAAASIPSSPTPACRSDAIRGELAESWEWKTEPAARRDQAAQGRDVPGEAGRHEEPRVQRSRTWLFSFNRLNTSPKKHHHLLRPRRQGRGAGQAHRRLPLQGLLRRVGLPLRLGLLLADLRRRRWSTPAPATGRT